MKKINSLIAAAILFFAFALDAQAQYYNEWIDHNQTYYRISTNREGLVRIPYTTLVTVGLDGLPGSGFKVFYKGQEILIYVSTNGIFGFQDYIEFYAEKMDGEFDTQLYQDPSDQWTDLRSLFARNTRHFLTWDSSSPGLRYENNANNLAGAPPAEPFFVHTETKIHNNKHERGKPVNISGFNNYFGDFGEGEGFSSSAIQNGQTQNYNFSTPAVYTGLGAPQASVETRLIGQKDDFIVIDDHHVHMTINGTVYGNYLYEGYNSIVESATVFLSDITPPTTQVSFTSLADMISPGGDDWNSVVYTSLSYPRSFDFGNARNFRFTLADNAATYLEIGNFNSGTEPILYDFTNKKRYVPIIDGATFKFNLAAGANPTIPRELVLVNTTSSLSLKVIEEMDQVQYTDYSQVANQGNYIIITHPSLREGATDEVAAYAAYRESLAGRNYNVVIANIEELYDQYAWGIEKHPLSIRHFINDAIDNWTIAPEYVLLMGKSISYNEATNNPLNYDKCLVPSYGHFPSDNMLAARSIDDYIPQLPIGRLSAQSPESVRAYLDKLIEYETPLPCTVQDRAWTNNVAHLSSGYDVEQSSEFVAFLDGYKDIVEGIQYAGNVVGTFVQSSPSTTPQPGFTAAMNNGLAIVTLMGHSSGGSWNFDLKDDPTFYTSEHYPFFLSGSCFVGNVHGPLTTQMEDYVLSDGHGAIAFMATVSFGFPSYLDIYCTELYTQFSNTNYGQPLGNSIVNTLNNIYVADPTNGQYKGIKITSEEYNLQGDPAVIIPGFSNPEYILGDQNTDLQVINPTTGLPITGSPATVDGLSQIQFSVTITNVGSASAGSFVIQVVREQGGNFETVASETVVSPLNEQTYSILVNIDPATQAGLNNYTVSVNSTAAIAEDCFDNNSMTIPIQIQGEGCAGAVVPIINPIPTVYCPTDAAVALSADIAGGVFAVDGNVVPNSFNPGAFGAGVHNISYNYIYPATGCEVVAGLQVTVNPIPNAQISSAGTSVCMSESVIVSAQNFSPTASYNWNFGGASANTPLGNETYELLFDSPGQKTLSLQVSDNGCTSGFEPITINVDAPLAKPDLDCNSDLNNITYTWDDIAGSNGYSLLIDGTPISIPAGQTTYTLTGLNPGESASAQVVAIGTGACGNSEVSDALQCFAQNCPVIEPQFTNLSSAYCLGDAAFALAAEPAGGNFAINGNPVTDFDPAGLGEGVYTVTYQYADGDCSYAADAESVSVDANPESTSSGPLSFCPGETITLNATAGLSNYAWSNSESGESITVGAANNYAVTVTNAAGCTALQTFEVIPAIDQTPVLVSADGTTTLCSISDNITLQVDPIYLQYVWSVTASDPEVTVNAPGIYGITVTDSNGCEWSDEIEIVDGAIDEPEVLVNGSTTGSLCVGESAQLDAGTGYDSYAWSNSATTQTIEVTDPGTYNVTVTNSTSCSAVGNKTIAFVQVSTPDLSASASVVCPGFDTFVDAGDGYDSYVWSTGDTEQVLTVTAIGDYTVTVTLNGCEAISDNLNIANMTTPTPSASAQTICPGSETSIDAGAGYDSYLWSDGETTQVLTVTAAGDYAVTVTLGDCEEVSENVSIENVTAATPTASASGICDGDDATIDAGAGYDGYLWSNGETTQVLTVTAAGDYAVTVTTGDCDIATDAVNIALISEIAAPTAIFAVEDASICKGDVLSLQNNSEGATDYAWTVINDNDGTEQASSEANPSFSFDAGGDYTVRLVASIIGNCDVLTDEREESAFFFVSEGPDAEIITEEQEICSGESLDLEAEGNADSYRWEGSGVTNASGTTVNVTPDLSGYYHLLASDEYGCAVMDSVEITLREICDFEIPNVITPNGDSFNDYWHIPQADTGNEAIRVEIYNRWGQLVYEDNGYTNGNAWEGTNTDGKDLPHATYYYIIYFNDGSEPVAGDVTILR